MTMKRTIFLAFLLLLTAMAWAQNDKKNTKKQEPKKTAPTSNTKSTPSNMWEIGAHGGYLFSTGDVPTNTGYGAGLHLRKALDYVFSLRGEAIYGKFEGMGTDPLRQFENQWLSATVFGIANLNSLRWNKPVRTINIYAGAGVGANYYAVDGLLENDIDPQRIPDTISIDREIAPQILFMAGIAFRLGKRFNVGLEHQVGNLLGRRTDLIDGVEKELGVRTPFGDIIQYASLRLNFNIGSSKNSEPLYWVNPLDLVLKDISDVKKRTDTALKDSDGDGVIDAIDQEPDTPSDAPVDTKGRTLDSDRDGVADFKDKEPYNPPRAGERVNTQGIIENPDPSKTGGVSEDRVREIVDEMLQGYKLTESANAVADWFLPMIHFGSDSYSIKYADYGTLAGIAKMLKSNTNMRIVVTGYADSTASEDYNDKISFQRAQAVIDHLVENHAIGRGRLVLQWKGEKDLLVPSGNSYMNRRVEFRVALADDVEMDPPAGANPTKKDGY